MNFLITGSTGFIGKNLVKMLSRNPNNNLYCIYHKTLPHFKNKNVNYYKYDGNINSLMKIKDELHIIIHLATHYSQSNEPYHFKKMFSANLIFGYHLLEFATRRKVFKFINTGSFSQFFDSDIYNPQNLYAASKQCFEVILKFYINTKKINLINLYLYEVYGPNDHRPKFVNQLIKSIKEKKSFKMSEGNQKIRPVYIDDVLDAYNLAIKVLNKCDRFTIRQYSIHSEQISLIELAKYCKEIFNSDIIISNGYYGYRDREIMNTEPIFDLIPGWEQKVSLKKGLINTFNDK